MLIAICLFILVSLIVFAFGYRFYVRPARMLDRLARTTSDALLKQLEPQHKPKQDFSLARLVEPIGNLLPVSPQDAGLAKKELCNAGFRSSSAVSIYYGIKIVLAIILGLGGLILRGHFNGDMLRLILPIAAAGIGFFVPSFGLGFLVKKRHEKIRLALPDVLDLLVICSEAGCGLDQAMVNVSRELASVHPAVCDELSLVNMEIMAGKSRAEALRNFGRRTNEEEIKKLVGILIQTDRFGTSVAEALRTQSDFLRVRRRQIAEEKAGKVGVKLVFPIFFFSLPALVIVTAGPGLLQIFTELLPAMRGFGQ